MASRERTAWISFIAVAVVFGVYFTAAMTSLAAGEAADLVLLAVCVVALIVLQGVLHGIVAARVAITGQAEPTVPADERERLIELKATRAAFYAMTTAALLAIFTIHLGAHTVLLANAVLAAIVIGELVRSGGIVLGYRGAW